MILSNYYRVQQTKIVTLLQYSTPHFFLNTGWLSQLAESSVPFAHFNTTATIVVNLDPPNHCTTVGNLGHPSRF